LNNTVNPEPLPARARRGLFVFAGFIVLLAMMLNSEQPWLEFAAIAILGGFVLRPFLQRRNPVAWLMLLGILAVAGYATYFDRNVLLSFLPQVLLSVMFMLIFGRTLRAGSVPLITRISTDMRQGQSAVPFRYTRGLTLVWTIFFALLALEGLVLGLFAPPGWVLKVSAMTWAFIGVFIASEYLYHTRRFPNPRQHGLLDFMRDLALVDYRRLLDE
jgi:uncharacterized membrane protein